MHIELYTKSRCSFCTKAEAILDINFLSYTTIKMQETEMEQGTGFISREDMIIKFPTAKTMPIVIVDGSYIGGFEELRTMLQAELA
jgi:glutaredoxin